MRVGLCLHEEGVSVVAFASGSYYAGSLRVLPVCYGVLGVVCIVLLGFIGGCGVGWAGPAVAGDG